MKYIKNEISNLSKQSGACHSNYALSNKVQRKVLIKYALRHVDSFKRPFSVTLTMIGSESRVKDEIEAKFESLVRKISKRTYKKRAKRIRYFAVMEGDEDTRYHIHVIFDVPKNKSESDLLRMLNSFWRSLGDVRNGKRRDLAKEPIIHVSEFNSASRATSYLLKTRSKDKKEDFSSYVIP